MNATLLRSVMSAMEVTRSKAVQSRVVNCVQEHKCLIPTCDCEDETRGLCDKHYREFLRRLVRAKDKLAFNLDQQRKGLILDEQEIRELRNPSVFSSE